MKTPRFWASRNSLSTALLPLSVLYYLGSELRKKFTVGTRVSVPVICVGNLTTGGAGKTPVALAIADRLKAKHINAFFVSRGYGGFARGPLLVNPDIHTAKEVGDEPLLLAKKLPTIIGKNRLAAAQFAIEQGAQVIVMDDGFQNPTITKDLSFIVVDRRLSFGNERILPAGPLREPVGKGLARANAIIIVNPANFLPTHLPHIPVIIARTTPDDTAMTLAGKKLFAFCGIAYPKKFYRMLARIGADIAGKTDFADHYHYSEKDLAKLKADAAALGAQLVTTAKDATRIPTAFKADILVAEMHLNFEDEAALDVLLESVLHG